jgi:hypothetical protein
MSFILAMDPFQKKILHLAIEKNLLHPVAPRSMGIKVSLYTDDTTLFIHHCSKDFATLKEILAASVTQWGSLHQFAKNGGFHDPL